jgi:hypothetical protein
MNRQSQWQASWQKILVSLKKSGWIERFASVFAGLKTPAGILRLSAALDIHSKAAGSCEADSCGCLGRTDQGQKQCCKTQ